MSACITPEKVQEAFLASAPYIASQILDLSIKHPSWLRDVWSLKQWESGQGTVMQQFVFRGGRPKIERGFDKWKKLGNVQGCDPCDGPDCTYNWTPMGGHAMERKLTELMRREFKSNEYCVHEIQTTAHFKEVFAKIVENLYHQVDYFKEMNIGLNFLTALAKKFVVDSGGAKVNTNNPYVYRNVGSARLSTLNINMLEFFYEHLRRIPDAVPYDVVNGSPIYSLMASHQLLARLYRDDPQLREDVRFSGMANDNLMKYNFMSTIRGMFIAAPILYPRRFNLVEGEPYEVLPFVDDVPGEVGKYTYLNSAYEAATHEEVIIHGKHPFELLHLPTEQTLGANTSFGPEYSFMNNWSWVNPLTYSDPFRRVGYFATSAQIGVSQQFSDGIYAILVERPSTALMAMYTPNPVCPPEAVDCENEVPDVTCPCPVLAGPITVNPFVANSYFFTFATPVVGEPEAAVNIQLDNNLYITGELVQISADGKTAEILFETPLDIASCNIIGIYCDSQLACSSSVVFASDCRSDQTDSVDLTLDVAIKALEAGDEIKAYFGDCTTAMLEVVAVDAGKLVWTVKYAEGYGPTDDPEGEGYTVLTAGIIGDRGGISKVCVPTETDASCPACETELEACVNPEEEG